MKLRGPKFKVQGLGVLSDEKHIYDTKEDTLLMTPFVFRTQNFNEIGYNLECKL